MKLIKVKACMLATGARHGVVNRVTVKSKNRRGRPITSTMLQPALDDGTLVSAEELRMMAWESARSIQNS